MSLPLTTSAATVQRLVEIERKRSRREREVAIQANLLGAALAALG